MAGISSLGIGSGLDISSIVDQLLYAERAPAEMRLNRREASYQAELSAFGTLKSTVSLFQDAVAKLVDFRDFTGLRASSSDSDLVSATASDGAVTGNYNIEVSKLAQVQTLASKAFADTTLQVGTGTLTFEFGSYDDVGNSFTPSTTKSTKSVDISATDNSLVGIRDAVNSADIGVTASIINDGSGYRLVFNSDDSGAQNSLKITVNDTTDANNSDNITGLSQLAYDPTAAVDNGKNMSETVSAQDAQFTVNGLAISSSDNDVSDVVEGVTFTLKAETSGPVAISLSQNNARITKSVEDFVAAYNDMIKGINTMTAYNAETGKAGILQGDSIPRGLTSQVRTILSNAVPGLDGAYTTLRAIGITSGEGGVLSLDKSKLSDALNADYTIVGRLFAASGSSSDSLINFLESNDESQIGDYDINITQLATRGSLSGVALAGFPLSVDANNDNFTVKVDGVTSSAINLTNKSYSSGDELAAELQRQINGDSALKGAGASVVVSFVTDHFEIVSSKYGSGSTIELLSVDTNSATTLGLSVGAGSAGIDVAGTINGVAASGNGQVLSGSGKAEGIKLEVLGGATGSRGKLTFSRGVADQLNTLLDGYLTGDSLINARTQGLNNRIDDINEQRERLALRLEMLEKRYLKQFTAMDAMMSQMQSTSSYLAQQLAALPLANSNKK